MHINPHKPAVHGTKKRKQKKDAAQAQKHNTGFSYIFAYFCFHNALVNRVLNLPVFHQWWADPRHLMIWALDEEQV